MPAQVAIHCVAAEDVKLAFADSAIVTRLAVGSPNPVPRRHSGRGRNSRHRF